MSFIFIKASYRASINSGLRNTADLFSDNWDDFGFKTTFTLRLYNQAGTELNIGDLPPISVPRQT